MFFVFLIYMALTFGMGISAIWSGLIYRGIAGIVGPALCWFAASGLKGSFMIGSTPQKLGGFGAAILFVGVGIGIVYQSDYWVRLFGYEFSGVTWCVFGFAVGWIGTDRPHALA